MSSRVAGRPRVALAGPPVPSAHGREHDELWAAVGRLTRAVVQLRMDLADRAHVATGLDPRSPRYSPDRRTLRGAIRYELGLRGRRAVTRRVPAMRHVRRVQHVRSRWRRNPAAALAMVLIRQPLAYVKTALFVLLTFALLLWLLWVGVGRPIADTLGKVIPGVYTPASATSCGPVDVQAGGRVGAAWEVGHRARRVTTWDADPDRIRSALFTAAASSGQTVGWVKRALDGAAAPTTSVNPTVYAQTASGSCLPCPTGPQVRTVVAVTGGSTEGLPMDAVAAVRASRWADEPADVQRMAVAIVAKESSDDPTAVNPKVVVLDGRPNQAYGLFQVMLPLHEAKLPRAQALDPVANANAGHAIYVEQGWAAWDVAQDGSYREALEEAEQALAVDAGATPDPAVCAAASGLAQPAGLPATPAGPAVEQAVAYALAQQGKPYRWGAAPDDEPGLPAPASFDCSSLLDSAYLAAGIDLPGRATTRSLLSMGTPVAEGELRRGDLVWTSPGHIGMALDNGPDTRIVHAPQTGDFVKVSKLWSFYMARRVATEGVQA